jgi:hypothetical protein
MPIEQGFRTDRFLGGNIVGDDCTQHLLAAFLGCGCH